MLALTTTALLVLNGRLWKFSTGSFRPFVVIWYHWISRLRSVLAAWHTTEIVLPSCRTTSDGGTLSKFTNVPANRRHLILECSTVHHTVRWLMLTWGIYGTVSTEDSKQQRQPGHVTRDQGRMKIASWHAHGRVYIAVRSPANVTWKSGITGCYKAGNHMYVWSHLQLATQTKLVFLSGCF